MAASISGLLTSSDMARFWASCCPIRIVRAIEPASSAVRRSWAVTTAPHTRASTSPVTISSRTPKLLRSSSGLCPSAGISESRLSVLPHRSSRHFDPDQYALQARRGKRCGIGHDEMTVLGGESG